MLHLKKFESKELKSVFNNKKENAMRKFDFKKGVVLTVMLVCGLSGFAQTKKYVLDSLISSRDRYYFSYDNNGNCTWAKVYRLQNNAWKESREYEFTYDANGNQTLRIGYYWQNDDWGERNKTEKSYDANGNDTLQIDYTWQNNDWVKSSKYENTYNLSYSKTDLIYILDFAMSGMLTERRTYSWNGTGWNNTDVYTFYWSEWKTTGIVETRHATSLQVYPNPTRDILHFSLATPFEIRDIQGRMLLKNDKAVESVNINSLPSGIYFITLSTERGKTVKKIIKE